MIDRFNEVAFETAVVGRLRRGYRVLELRSLFGTRIELCYLFVRVALGSQPHLWPSPRHMYQQSSGWAARSWKRAARRSIGRTPLTGPAAASRSVDEACTPPEHQV